jgi:hypothetical protein
LSELGITLASLRQGCAMPFAAGFSEIACPFGAGYPHS